MAGRLETSIWNLTFVATATACGPTIPIDDDGGEESFDDDGSGTVDSDPTVDPPPCEDGVCPECQSDADCDPSEYCTSDGRCEYYNYCGVAPGEDVFRCSPPPYYDCYTDADCDEDERCEIYECVPAGCDQAVGLVGPYDISVPDGPIVDLAFVDIDGDGAQELAIATSTTVVLASSFNPALTQIATGEDFVSVAAGDVDADGDLDIVVAERGQGGHLVVITNENTAFTPFATLASPGGLLEVLLGDPENDGSIDAFVRTDGGIARHRDLGPQSSLVATPVTAMALAGWSLAFSSQGSSWWLPVATLEPTDPNPMAAFEMQSLATARLDTDVDPDVIGVVDVDGTTNVYSWRGPIADDGNSVPVAGNYPLGTAADVNGDGLSEAIVAGDGLLIVLSSSPGADTPFGCATETATTHASYLIAAGDYDGNGSEDIVISDGVTITMFQQDQGG